ncbi:MAG: NlpC/P60 family protein [Ruminococcaceae bacterium]|nr:NlpC/P60 family protein [Oscillospiraceae bacterium]
MATVQKQAHHSESKITEDLLMRNLFKVIFAATLLLLVLSVCASADGERAYTKADVLNVRSQPSTSASIVGQYYNGSFIQIAGKTNEWYKILHNGKYAYVHSDYVVIVPNQASSGSSKGQAVVNTAMQFIGTPYVYGGMSPAGFDCSGFVKYVYSLNGANLSRVSSDQANDGYYVSRDQLQPGDIVCFASGVGSSYIGHVGIYVGNNQFIHSPRTGYTVTIESLDSGSYGLRYVCARRIF